MTNRVSDITKTGTRFVIGDKEGCFRFIDVAGHRRYMRVVEHMEDNKSKVDEDGRANVAFICKALNAHHDLVNLARETAGCNSSIIAIHAASVLEKHGLLDPLQIEIKRLSDIIYPGRDVLTLPTETLLGLTRLARTNLGQKTS